MVIHLPGRGDPAGILTLSQGQRAAAWLALLRAQAGLDSLPLRAGHESLARRPHVRLPVPEWLQPCVDPALHAAARKAPSDHGDGGMQPGAAAHLTAGG